MAALLACGICLLVCPPAHAAPAWLPPTDLSAPGKDAAGPSVAVAASGETVAVWARRDAGTNFTVQAATRSPGSAFSAPIDLSTTSFDADVAMTPGGEAVAVWRKFDVASGKYLIQAATRSPGGAFSGPIPISVSAAAAQPQGLRVAASPSGVAAVAWVQKDLGSAIDPDQFSVLVSVRAAGGGFSAPTMVSTSPPSTETEAASPRLAIDAGGAVTVVWTYDDGTDSLIEGATMIPGSGFSVPLPLSEPGGDAGSPAIAAAANGSLVAAWTRSNGSENVVEAATGSAGGGFSSPSPLSAPGEDAGSPATAMSAAGEARVAWIRSNGSDYLVESATGFAAASFSAPVKLSSLGISAFDPALAVEPGGGAAVVWKRSNGGSELVEGAVAAPAGNFSAPTPLSAPGQDAISPAVAMDAAGDATAVWLRSNGSNAIVQAAGYDADVPQLRAVSIPASGTVGVPVQFSASPFDVWPISATTFSFGDGTVASGTAVSHAYAAPGTYPVAVTATDAAGTETSAGGTIAIRPSSDFAIGKLKLNKRKGTGTLTVTVPGPGELVLSGKGLKRAIARAGRAGNVRLPVRPLAKVRRKLNERGRVKVGLKVAFTPDGGDTSVRRRTATLIEKLR